MEEITLNELGIDADNIPDTVDILINKDELNYPPHQRIYQVGFKDDLDNGMSDVLTYLLKYDDSKSLICPYIAPGFDRSGVYRKELEVRFPQLYRKAKDDLIRIVN